MTVVTQLLGGARRYRPSMPRPLGRSVGLGAEPSAIPVHPAGFPRSDPGSHEAEERSPRERHPSGVGRGSRMDLPTLRSRLSEFEGGRPQRGAVETDRPTPVEMEPSLSMGSEAEVESALRALRRLAKTDPARAEALLDHHPGFRSALERAILPEAPALGAWRR